MKQPKTVRIKDGSEKKLFNLPDSAIPCILQEREPDDDSEVVYIHNPKYTKGSKEQGPYIAFTKSEYEVVEWSE